MSIAHELLRVEEVATLLRTTPKAIYAMVERRSLPGVVRIGRRVLVRHEVALEQYNKTINIEAQLMVLMGNRYILPAAIRYQGQVADSVARPAPPSR